jgi:hypothetical protein
MAGGEVTGDAIEETAGEAVVDSAGGVRLQLARKIEATIRRLRTARVFGMNIGFVLAIPY